MFLWNEATVAEKAGTCFFQTISVEADDDASSGS